ncbi:fluoride efflux transporter CrcB [Neobacillus massiliamazoniensis]|uniref:Fluoride-specific ion channel FluC n=1 Tax=Neobacillus massiliamazoniensis TaxID=1499688 RepID=A0A0U1P0E2_9BACI|nr:fluoride efflux transporter CrcB [Neobacillus massiliamazoniensis]CRK83745.1 crcB protein [Neobacillus massiliamazoniensis]
MLYLFIGIGGIIGSMLRYLVSIIAVQIWGKDFPLGTLLINLSGSFFLGWFTSAIVNQKKMHPYILTAISTGIVGSYTTFSTFCFETVHLFQMENYLKAFFYLLLSLFGGLFFVRLGVNVGEQQIKK